MVKLGWKYTNFHEIYRLHEVQKSRGFFRNGVSLYEMIHFTFLTRETITMVVVKLSRTADIKKVINPTTHIRPLFLFDVMTSVTTLKPTWKKEEEVEDVEEEVRRHPKCNKESVQWSMIFQNREICLCGVMSVDFEVYMRRGDETRRGRMRVTNRCKVNSWRVRMSMLA